MNTSIKSAIFILLLVNLCFFNLVAASYNADYDILPSCNNNTDNCYPFWYENSDGSSNVFANIVAMLNYISPAVNLGCYKLGNKFICNIDKNIDIHVKKILEDLMLSEDQIKRLLTKIIVNFNNGIGRFKGDNSCISGAVTNLNRDKCQTCIDHFVKIVSDIYTKENNKKHRRKFKNFADNLIDNCTEIEHEKMSSPNDEKRAFPDKINTACCDKWTHPFHWSSSLYATGSLMAPPIISLGLDVNNRAGSFIGDIANVSNILVIPSIYMFNCFQYWKNSDRTKVKRLSKEISNYLVKIDGIIEIAAQVIAKMDNKFDKNTAKSIITTLVLMAWPQEQVDKFISLASNNETRSDQVKFFVDELKDLYEKKHYDNRDINKLFPLTEEEIIDLY